MSEADEDREQLDHFIEHVRLLLAGETMEGLDAWSRRFGELRQTSQFDLCRRLAHAIRNADLPQHGLGIVRYGEGWLYDRMGRWQDSIKAYEASLAAFRGVGIDIDTTLLTQIGSVHQDRGNMAAAGKAYQEALDSAKAPHARALVLNNLGNLALQCDDLDAAERHYGEARELLRDHDQRNYAAATHGFAAVLLARGKYPQSQELQVECLNLFLSFDDMHGAGSAVGGIATVHLYAGHYREAVHNYRAALDILLDSGDVGSVPRTLANLAIAHQELGEYDQALERLTQAIAGYEEVGDEHGEALARVNLARLYHSNEDHAAALAAAETARNVCERYGFLEQLRRLPTALR
ncbi:tetratricopeptide repeat protein [Streptomyces sp. MMBL 11-3]|uniref:tetratricopeptide repeat protein n=1 Tax=Streptomyces sp. MMBL 11-3 TaxID=3382639 RepID=UPI0039B63C56